VCVGVLSLPFARGQPHSAGGAALPHGSALHSPACTPSPTSRPPRPARIWPVQRSTRPLANRALSRRSNAGRGGDQGIFLFAKPLSFISVLTGTVAALILLWYSEQSELAEAATSPQARNRSDSIYFREDAQTTL
jgi:hypothetical protein